MAANIEIVPVRRQTDLQTVAGLGRKIWYETFPGILTDEQIEYMLERFQSYEAISGQIKDKGYEYFLALKGKTPVGYMGVQAEGDRLMLSKIYTLKKMHGTGLADLLFERLYEVAREHGCTVVWLTVNRHNERAVGAYKKRGFEVVREQVADIGGGYVMDDYVMERRTPE